MYIYELSTIRGSFATNKNNIINPATKKMKRINHLLVIILLSFNFSGNAQERQIIVGVLGGVGYTNLPCDYTKKIYNPKINIHYGVSVDVPIGKKLSIGTGINYRKKSRKSDPFDLTDNTGNSIGKERTEFYSKFVTIPVCLAYSFGKKNQFRFGLGGYYGRAFETGYYYNKLKIEGLDNPNVITNQFSRNDFGAFARIGFYTLIFENIYLNFDISEEFGLNNINSESKQQSLLGKMTTQSLSIGLGIAYGF